MWIEFSEKLINLSHIESISIDGCTVILMPSNENNFSYNETLKSDSQAQQRYDEIKKMLINNSIIEKLDTIIKNQDYWGQEIKGNTRR